MFNGWIGWVTAAALLVVTIMLVLAISDLESERSKRTGLERENERITSIMDRVVKSTMQTRHTLGDCYYYQGEISFLIAEYYGLPDSLLAVPPNKMKVAKQGYIYPETTIIDGWDSSEVTDTLVFDSTMDSIGQVIFLPDGTHKIKPLSEVTE